MALERFHFNHDGKSYEMPFFSQLKVGTKIELLDAIDLVETRPHLAMKAVIKIAGDAGDAVMDMTDEEFMELYKSWMESTPATSGK